MIVNIPFVSNNVIQSLETSSDLTVHSVFSNGINIQASGRPIFIGIQDGPSALQIESVYIPVVTKAKINDEVVYKNKQLIFKSLGLIFDMRFSQVKNYELCKKRVTSVMSDKFMRLIIGYNYMTGLDLLTEDLINCLIKEFDYDQMKYLDYLFGRGKGLTPSGDDFILGMLAYHHVNPYLSDEFIKQLESKMNSNLTTDISVNYLKDALQGYFVRDIINLFNSLQDGGNIVARIYKITSFGHTSGKDTLSGIAMGILMEEELRRKK